MTNRLTPYLRASPARRTIVAAAGVWSAWRGAAYLMPLDSLYAPAADGGALAVITGGVLPAWVVGMVWLLAGIYAIGCAIAGRWIVATSMIGGLTIAWGLGYLVAWIAPGWGKPTDWISFGTYFWQGIVILAAVLIREPPRVVIRED